MNNKYYIIYNSIDPRETGKAYPQVKISYDVPNWIEISAYDEKKLPAKATFPDFHLEKGAKLTDFLTNNYATIPANALISEKFFEILVNFSNPGMQPFPINLFHKRGISNFYLVHFYDSPTHLIDFEKTKFERTHWPNQDTETYQFSSYEEFHSVRYTTGIKGCVIELYLKREIFSYDFFTLPVPRIWGANRKLAETLIEEKISGIKIVPCVSGENFCEDKHLKINRTR